MNKSVREILDYSREVGNDPMMVIGGGGNSSAKTRDKMWVKASGYSMGSMPPEALLCLDLQKVLSLMKIDVKTKKRSQLDARIAGKLIDARINPPRPDIRPSVEAMLHAAMPFRFVMHTHPELTAALTASKDGERIASELKIPPYLWIEYIDPGLPLAQKMVKELEKSGSNPPRIIFLAKHGFIVAADSIDELKKLTQQVFCEIRRKLKQPARKKLTKDNFGDPFVKPLQQSGWDEAMRVLAPTLRGALDNTEQIVLPHKSTFLNNVLCGRAAKKAVTTGPLSPDQVVYCKTFPLFIRLNWKQKKEVWHEKFRAAVKEYQKRNGCDPQVVLVPGFGAFFIGGTFDYVQLVKDMYLQALRISVNAKGFGGIRPMTRREFGYIANWSMEKYRRGLVEDTTTGGRAKGKVAIVTGAAQGVGRDIAFGLAGAGATVVVCDINAAGVKETAADICAQFGERTAFGFAADVTKEKAMRKVVLETLKQCGGLDLLIANAGILRAHKVTEFPVEDFRRIIDINLVGVFISAKSAAEVMRYARSGDIIQLNSKSGKKGSKYNCGYAASKFAGVGLVQSLALDLVEDGLKVNAICPGNFFDLPLWSSPGGLFDQYSQKFHGASREEVRKIYERQVPVGRGCRVSDVVKTILYILDQEYETGQAYNVTGGQEMR